MDGFKSRDGGCWRETVSAAFEMGWGRKAGRQRRGAWSHGDGPDGYDEKETKVEEEQYNMGCELLELLSCMHRRT
jgi:hypothetical protein